MIPKRVARISEKERKVCGFSTYPPPCHSASRCFLHVLHHLPQPTRFSSSESRLQPSRPRPEEDQGTRRSAALGVKSDDRFVWSKDEVSEVSAHLSPNTAVLSESIRLLPTLPAKHPHTPHISTLNQTPIPCTPGPSNPPSLPSSTIKPNSFWPSN